MGQLANIVSVNADPTPVNYTFSPMGPDANGVQWFEQVTPVPSNGQAACRASISVKRAVSTGRGKSLTGIAKVEIAVWLPTMETVSNSSAGIAPAPTVAYECAVRAVYFLPERSTKQERKNVRALFNNLWTNATVLACVDDMSPLY